MKKIGVFWAAWIYALSVGAQSFFAPFAAQSADFKVGTQHFEVHYAKEAEAEVAARVAKYAEMALGEIGFLYDYKPQSRYHLLWVSHPTDLLYQNYLYPDKDFEVGYGEIPLPKLDAVICMPPVVSDLYATVKREVSTLVLKEFEYGQDLPRLIQNELLNYQAPWFYRGLTDFAATGWTYEDEAFLPTTDADKWVSWAIEGEDLKSQTLRKSIWFYIAQTYGPQKFAEMVYLAKIAHSVETSVITVLGIDLATFTNRWREQLLQHTEAVARQRSEAKDLLQSQRIPLPKDARLLNFSLQPAGKWMALWVEKKGKYSLWLYDLKSRELHSTPLVSGYSTEILAHFRQFGFPIAWKHASDELLTFQLTPTGLSGVLYAVESQEMRPFTFNSDFTTIFSMSFSHNDKWLAVAAMHKKGQADLFRANADGTNWKAITQDGFDELQPCWSYDDARIYFASNRNSTDLSAKVKGWNYFKENTDIYAYELSTSRIERITETPAINEISPYNPNSFELYFLSDERGMWDAYSLNLFQPLKEGKIFLRTGIHEWNLTEEGQAFSTYENEKLTLTYSALIEKQATEPPLTPFRLAYLNLQERKSIVTHILPPPTTPKDTAKIKGELRYYIFEDGQAQDHVVYSDSEIKTSQDLKAKPYVPLWDKLEVQKVQGKAADWRAEKLQFQLVYHPLARAGFRFGVAFHDFAQHQHLYCSVTPYFSMLPFIQFGNADAVVRYKYRKRRTDFWVEVNGWRRNYQQESISPTAQDTISYRFSSIEFKAGAEYPFTVNFKAGGSQSLLFLQKYDLRFGQVPQLQDDRQRVFKTSLFAEYKNLKRSEDFPIKGNQARFETSLYKGIGESPVGFALSKLSFQHFRPIWKQIVWATQFNGGVAVGRQTPNFYLGGIDNWALGILHRNRPTSISYTGRLNPNLASFGFQEFILPLRGFWFNTRNGNKYLTLNTEVRIPLTRLLKRKLNDKWLYNWEFIPFADAGTIWRVGNPFSRNQPTDFQIIPSAPVIVEYRTFKSPFLYCFGTGIKTRLLNYQIRADIAWGVEDNTFQRPRLMIGMGRSF